MSGRMEHHVMRGRFGWMELAEVVGVIACLAGFLVVFTTFMWIYLAGAACSFESYITVNSCNEADFEFILLLVLFPFTIFAIIRWVRRMSMEKRGWG